MSYDERQPPVPVLHDYLRHLDIGVTDRQLRKSSIVRHLKHMLDRDPVSNKRDLIMIFKTVIASTIAFSAMASAALAAPPTWIGTFVVNAVSAGCTADGNTNTVGEFGTITYRPIISGGDPAEGMAFFFTRSTELIISGAAGGYFQGAVNFTGIEVGKNVKPDTTTGSSNMLITPGTITANTKTITIKGHINNFFDNTPQCDVNFEALLQPRI